MSSDDIDEGLTTLARRSMLAFSHLPEGAAGTATLSSTTNFLGAVRRGPVEATARLLHRGRTTIVVETDLVDARGRRVARVTQTQVVLGPR
ncbi:MAG: PaaI family thioesterase [Actinomycetota bacterium]|nr:PaaI family thioesterase [Actinomycetota bacterium]